MNVPNASRQPCPSWMTYFRRAAAMLALLPGLAVPGLVWGQANDLFNEEPAGAPTAEPTAPEGDAATDAAPAARPPGPMSREELQKLVTGAFEQAKELMVQGEWAKAADRLSYCIAGFAEAGNAVPADIFFARGRCYSELKQHDAAILDFERITKKERQVPPGLLIQAQIESGKAHYALGQYDKAKKVLDKAGQAFPQNAEIMFQRAQTMLRLAEQLGRDEEGLRSIMAALALLDRAITTDPKNVAAILERSQAHLSLGNLDEAVKDLESAGELSQDKPEYVGRVGYLYLSRAMRQQSQESASRPDVAKDLERAIGAFDRYLAAMDATASDGEAHQPPQPDAVETPSNGPVAPGAAEPPRATEQPERDAASNPYTEQLKRESILLARATARMQLAKFVSKSEKSSLYQSAMRDCEAAIATDPKVAQAHYQRAVILRLLGQWEEAIRAFTETISLAGQQDRQIHSEALLRRGIVWFHRGDYGQSLQDFTAASGGGLSDGRAQFWMGVSYAQQGDDATAIWHFTESLSESPRYVLALKNRGLAYLRIGAYERAADDFIQVIRRDPNNSQAHYLRSQALQRLGRSSEAARSLESANRVSRSTR